MRFALGIDLGCTNLRVGVADEEGRLVKVLRCPTEVYRGAQYVLQTVAGLARKALEDSGVAREDIVGVGVGSPGAIDVTTGVVVHATKNLPGWRGIPLAARLHDALGLPVVVDNDTNVIALGEHRYGAARGHDNFVCLALGSGVGGSVFLNGRPHRGSRSLGGDLGHVTVDVGGRLCNCGRQGCLETYASAWAIAQRARMRVAAGGETLIAELAEGDPDKVTAQTVLDAAREGDLFALVIVGEVTRAITAAVADLWNILDPTLFVLTGGVVHGSPELLVRIRAELTIGDTVHGRVPPELVGGALRDDAGVLGGVAMALAGRAY
jgi:glucokinase